MPAPGQRLGEYVLVDRVGAGAFGEVWRARHHAWSEQLVAVKIPTDPQFVRNLQREGAAIRRLEHPNIVRAINFDPFADPPYLVMEFVPGESLRDVIRRGALPPAAAAGALQQVLAALGHAHARGLVHRDVKPENVLVHQDARDRGLGAPGVVKLTDFGLGRTSARGGAESMLISRDDPDARQVVGSAAYMAPEQMDGEGEVDARADLYACGVVLFEMLTGRRPAGVELPSELEARVPRALDAVFRRAFARRERRFESAEAFAAALADAVRAPTSATAPASATVAVPPSPPPPVRPPALPRGQLSAEADTLAARSRVVGLAIMAAVFGVVALFAIVLAVAWTGTRRTAGPPASVVRTTVTRTPQDVRLDSPDMSRGPVVQRVGPKPPQPATAPARQRVRVVGRPGVGEAEANVRSFEMRYPDVVRGAAELELLKVHEASALVRDGAELRHLPGAFSAQTAVGSGGFIMLWGLYEHLPAGRYVIAYRVQAPQPVTGDRVCFLDVCVNGNTVAGRTPPAGDLAPPGHWRTIPVALELKEPATVEYRLWPYERVIALDRIYVYRAR